MKSRSWDRNHRQEKKTYRKRGWGNKSRAETWKLLRKGNSGVKMKEDEKIGAQGRAANNPSSLFLRMILRSVCQGEGSKSFRCRLKNVLSAVLSETFGSYPQKRWSVKFPFFFSFITRNVCQHASSKVCQLYINPETFYKWLSRNVYQL